MAFKEALRDDEGNDLPTVLTPELLTKGRELVALNVVPELQPEFAGEEDWSPNDSPDKLWQQMKQLRSIRGRLGVIYHDQFRENLIDMATNVGGRYSPVKHSFVE